MSEFKGTPGPWYRGGVENGKISINAGNYFVALVDESLAQLANAHLIAAAPDLLEALQAMVNRIEYYANLDDSQKPSIEDWSYTYNSSDMDAARAAISKALGQ